ncbi:hypothetical protein [Candidatus Thiodiazotropha sp. LNASS1]|uniref:hypothetical protein n=1 Tax=Candidatus Thiodiazotropha sp. LNASS1 TaxID=3096260 RepID=UPI0034E0253C
MDIFSELIAKLQPRLFWRRATVLFHVPSTCIKNRGQNVHSENGFFIDIADAVYAKNKGPVYSSLLGQPAAGWSAIRYFSVGFASQFEVTIDSFEELDQTTFSDLEEGVDEFLKNLSDSDRHKASDADGLVWRDDSFTPSNGYIFHVPLSPNAHLYEGIVELPVFGEAYVICNNNALDREQRYKLIKTGIDAGGWIFAELSSLVMGVNKYNSGRSGQSRTDIDRTKQRLIREDYTFLLLRFLMLHEWLYNDHSAYRLLRLVHPRPGEIYDRFGLVPPAVKREFQDFDASQLVEKIVDQFLGFIYSVDDTQFHYSEAFLSRIKKKFVLICKMLIVAITGERMDVVDGDIGMGKAIGLQVPDTKGSSILDEYCSLIIDEDQVPNLKKKNEANIAKSLVDLFERPDGGGKLQVRPNYVHLYTNEGGHEYHSIRDAKGESAKKLRESLGCSSEDNDIEFFYHIFKDDKAYKYISRLTQIRWYRVIKDTSES